jgi:autotransporter-associated beta strand protein/uncharacterized repeat protein (TIGR03803 family)
MLLPSWSKRCLRISRSHERSPASRASSSSRLPRLEALENRLVPDVTLATVTSNNISAGIGTSAAAPAVDSSGNIYDVALDSSGNSSIFEWVKATGKTKTLASFPQNPQLGVTPGLVIDSSGNLYGTTTDGGTDSDGTVFELPAGSSSIQTLAEFNWDSTGQGGRDPGALLLDGNTLYGTTEYGGAVFPDGTVFNYGTVFSVPTSGGPINTLATFNGANGNGPNDGLALSNGILYGTTNFGGPTSNGVVFAVPATGATDSNPLTDLASFSSNGAGLGPSGRLVVDLGYVFGTEREEGGASFGGSIFTVPLAGGKLATAGTFNGGAEGFFPDSGLVMVGRAMYGTTEAGGTGGTHAHGTVFEFIPGFGLIPNIASFAGTGSNGPFNSLTVDQNGDLYGTAFSVSNTRYADNIFKVSGLGSNSSHIPSLSFVTQPSGGEVNTTLGTVKVRMTNVPAGTTVTLTLGSGPDGANLGGTLTQPVIDGVATFSDLTIDQGGGYTLVATSGFLQASSKSFTIGPILDVFAPDEVEPGVPFDTVVEAINPRTHKIDTNFNGSVTLLLASSTLPDQLGGVVSRVLTNGTGILTNTLQTANDIASFQASNPVLAPAVQVVTKTLVKGDFITLTWTGKGKNALWDFMQVTTNGKTVTNWEDENHQPLKPEPGGTYNLVFPSSNVSRLSSTDDVANLTAASMKIATGYTFSGNTPLTLAGNVIIPAGAGAPTLNMPIVLAPGTTADIIAGKGSNVLFEGLVEGQGGIQKDGPGTLTFTATNNTYIGPTILVAGQVNLDNTDQLGKGPLTVQPAANSAVFIDPANGGTVTLHNPAVNLQGGTLDVLSGRMVLTGQVMVGSAAGSSTGSDVNVADGGGVTLDGTVSGSTLTVGSYAHKARANLGFVTLNGMLTTTVNDAGSVLLLENFVGTGTLNINGGHLTSDSSNSFNGPINVLSGEVLVRGDNALGTGPLTFGNGSSSALFVLDTQLKDAAVTLKNALSLNGGVLAVDGSVTFSGATTLLLAPLTLVRVAKYQTLTLQNGLGGTNLSVPDFLGEIGPGVLALGGELDFANVIVPGKKNFKALSDFSVGMGSVKDKAGDDLAR